MEIIKNRKTRMIRQEDAVMKWKRRKKRKEREEERGAHLEFPISDRLLNGMLLDN